MNHVRALLDGHTYDVRITIAQRANLLALARRRLPTDADWITAADAAGCMITHARRGYSWHRSLRSTVPHGPFARLGDCARDACTAMSADPRPAKVYPLGVSQWLADRLREQREIVDVIDGTCVWARTCLGDIFSDFVMRSVAERCQAETPRTADTGLLVRAGGIGGAGIGGAGGHGAPVHMPEASHARR